MLSETIEKFVPNSLGVSFSNSADENCDRRCRLINSCNCYAKRVETRRPVVQLAAVKARRTHPATICNQAILWLRLRRFCPWFRISVFGSLPHVSVARRSKGFREAFRAMVREAIAIGAKVHIPVESPIKAKYYQGIVGDLAIVRESVQSERRFINHLAPISFVVGKNGDKKRDKLIKAKQLIKKRYEKTGRKAILCPAIVGSSKCGKCTACSVACVDVIYLKH